MHMSIAIHAAPAPLTAAQAPISRAATLNAPQTAAPNMKADGLSIKTQRQLFAGAAGATAVTLGFVAAQKMAHLGASLGGAKGAGIGAAIGGIGTAVFVGAGLATISEPMFDPAGSVVAGGALAGAALGLAKGGLKGAVLGAGLGAGLGFAALKSAGG